MEMTPSGPKAPDLASRSASDLAAVVWPVANSWLRGPELTALQELILRAKKYDALRAQHAKETSK